jgi:hypothetical protein
VKPTDPKRIVAAGYDRMADRHLAWSGLRPSAPSRRFPALADARFPWVVGRAPEAES